MEPTSLQLTWFVLLGGLMAGYAILDGFDLGVGILHLFARGDTERRVWMHSVGPGWGGNGVLPGGRARAPLPGLPGAHAPAVRGVSAGLMSWFCGLLFRGVWTA